MNYKYKNRLKSITSITLLKIYLINYIIVWKIGRWKIDKFAIKILIIIEILLFIFIIIFIIFLIFHFWWMRIFFPENIERKVMGCWIGFHLMTIHPSYNKIWGKERFHSISNLNNIFQKSTELSNSFHNAIL